jgi:hypothetical protein
MSTQGTRVPFRRVLSIVGLSVAMCVLAAASAAADTTPTVTSVANVSGQSAWAVGCMDSAWGDGLPQNSEPAIAINPKNPLQQVAQWTDNSAGTVDTAFTFDRGRHWSRSLPRYMDTCTGRPRGDLQWAATSDPWLSWSSFGTVYMSALPWTNTDYNTGDYHVFTGVSSTSAARGFRWSPAVYLPNPLATSDKDAILADNKVPNLVYSDTRNAGFGLVGEPRGDGQLMFDRSTNAGQTWRHTIIADGHTADAFFEVRNPVQLADGTLVIASGVPAAMGGGTRAWWSTDRGLTWHGPGAPEPDIPQSASIGPYCGSAISAPTSGGQVAVLNGRTIVEIQAVNQTAAGPGDIYMQSSSDGGQTWSSALVYQSAYAVAYPSINSNPDGQLGLVFDQIDTSHVTCLGTQWAQFGGGQQMTIPTRTEFVVSRDGGHTWSPAATVGAAWWNLASAPVQTEFFYQVRLGDYQQLAGLPGGFATITIEGDALDTSQQNPDIEGLQAALVSEISTRVDGHQSRGHAGPKHRRHVRRHRRAGQHR